MLRQLNRSFGADEILYGVVVFKLLEIGSCNRKISAPSNDGDAGLIALTVIHDSQNVGARNGNDASLGKSTRIQNGIIG